MYVEVRHHGAGRAWMVRDTVCITMAATASIRDLRNHFPSIKKQLEAGTEVVLTERGKPKYRLSLYTEPPLVKPPPKNHLERLKRHQPRPMSRAASKALHEDNRGER